jgi:N utilization substance protein A
VRLASQLTGWDIASLTEAEDVGAPAGGIQRALEGCSPRPSTVDDVIAHLLVTEGFSSIEEVAFVPVEDLTEIEGFDEDIAEELRERPGPIWPPRKKR